MTSVAWRRAESELKMISKMIWEQPEHIRSAEYNRGQTNVIRWATNLWEPPGWSNCVFLSRGADGRMGRDSASSTRPACCHYVYKQTNMHGPTAQRCKAYCKRLTRSSKMLHLHYCCNQYWVSQGFWEGYWLLSRIRSGQLINDSTETLRFRLKRDTETADWAVRQTVNSAYSLKLHLAKM